MLMSLTKICHPWSRLDGPGEPLPSWVQGSTRTPLETMELERQGGTVLRVAVFEVEGRRYLHAVGGRKPFLSQGAFLSGLREVWPAMRWTPVKGMKLTAVAVVPEVKP